MTSSAALKYMKIYIANTDTPVFLLYGVAIFSSILNYMQTYPSSERYWRVLPHRLRRSSLPEGAFKPLHNTDYVVFSFFGLQYSREQIARRGFI